MVELVIVNLMLRFGGGYGGKAVSIGPEWGKEFCPVPKAASRFY
jgi:hypothetical protein